MTEFSRFLQLFQYQLLFSTGGSLHVKMAALGPLLFVEPHDYVTHDVTRAMEQEFDKPVYRSRLVSFLWKFSL